MMYRYIYIFIHDVKHAFGDEKPLWKYLFKNDAQLLLRICFARVSI